MIDHSGNTISEGDYVHRLGYPATHSVHFLVLGVYPNRIKINKPNWIRNYTFVESRLMLLCPKPAIDSK